MLAWVETFCLKCSFLNPYQRLKDQFGLSPVCLFIWSDPKCCSICICMTVRLSVILFYSYNIWRSDVGAFTKLHVRVNLTSFSSHLTCGMGRWKCRNFFHVHGIYILKINENATLVFSISFQQGLVNQNFAFIWQLYFTYSIKRSFFVLIDCKYALFKSTCSKTTFLTFCNVPHELFVFCIVFS